MKITFHGNTCFELADKKGTIVTDPEKSFGNADIVTFCKEDNTKAEYLKAEKHVFDWPGEFESHSIYIQGIASFNDEKEEASRNNIYCFHTGEYRICHVGLLNGKLDDATLEKIGNVDILMVPVGGDNALDPKKAYAVVDQIEPRAVVPMNYGQGDQNDVAAFLEVMGQKDVEEMNELNLSKTKLSEDKTEVFVLKKK